MANKSLHLISITCDNRDDTLNRDKPYLKVNGNTIWSGQNFASGTSQSLAGVAAASFASSTDMELWEEDAAPNADDFLGRYTVRASEAGAGPKTATFNQSGALYRVVYRVS
jgi:cytochrome oxidase Cu insertion factor (SCO1/SenC/PrrC family)